MRHISAPLFGFLVFGISACGPHLPGLDMTSQRGDGGGQAGPRQDGGLGPTPAEAGTPPRVDAPGARPDAASGETRPDVTSAEARPDAPPAEVRPDVAPAETRPDVAPAEARSEVGPAEARPDVALADTRPEAAEALPDARTDLGADGAIRDTSVARAPWVHELRIDEVLIDPNGNDLGHEWFEIVNSTAEALALTDLHVADGATDVAIDAAVLAAGARLVLGQSLDRAHNGDAPVDVSYGTRLALNNDADTIAVCLGPCADGVVLDAFVWTAPFEEAFVGHAITVDLDTGKTCAAATPYGTGGNFGTPGAPNAPCPPERGNAMTP
jgi:hypothetical protein